MRFHASCAALPAAPGYDAVLLLGPSGSGKSDLVLRLLGRGFLLVADDQVIVEDAVASAPPALAGLLEVRGLGIFRRPHVAEARLRLAVELGVAPERLPQPRHFAALGIPLVTIDPALASAPDRVMLALDAARGRASMFSGAFAGAEPR